MIKVTAFYKFFAVPPDRLKQIQTVLKREGDELSLRGLILVGTEGINATAVGEEDSIEKYKSRMERLFQPEKFFYKDSYTDKWNFKRLSVKIKPEIIAVGKPNLLLSGGREDPCYLRPEEWDREMERRPEILDIRNDYETAVGRFHTAKELGLSRFNEFPKKIDQTALNKNKKTLIYCTGGVRCEKALKIMKDKGFKEVYQLKGGILNYLKEKPRSFFKGECFVFDHRAALDQDLKPSRRFSLCPVCGQAGDVKTKCAHCEKLFTICRACFDKAPDSPTCSKNCAYHLKAGHKRRGKQNRPRAL